MTTHRDIYIAANLVIKHHGDSAASYAKSRTEELRVEGDEEGVVIWQRISAAVDELLSVEVPEGVRVN